MKGGKHGKMVDRSGPVDRGRGADVWLRQRGKWGHRGEHLPRTSDERV